MRLLCELLFFLSHGEFEWPDAENELQHRGIGGKCSVCVKLKENFNILEQINTLNLQGFVPRHKHRRGLSATSCPTAG